MRLSREPSDGTLAAIDNDGIVGYVGHVEEPSLRNLVCPLGVQGSFELDHIEAFAAWVVTQNRRGVRKTGVSGINLETRCKNRIPVILDRGTETGSLKSAFDLLAAALRYANDGVRRVGLHRRSREPGKNLSRRPSGPACERLYHDLDVPRPCLRLYAHQNHGEERHESRFHPESHALPFAQYGPLAG